MPFIEVLAKLKADWKTLCAGKGGHCPVCDRYGRDYGRALNRSMAKSLIWLAHAKRDHARWVDVPKESPRWLVRTNQLPSLRWWGLVERHPNLPGHNKTKFSGLWRPTELGMKFVAGEVDVPRTAITYAGEVLAMAEDDRVKISDCFKTVFDYEQIMDNPINQPD